MRIREHGRFLLLGAAAAALAGCSSGGFTGDGPSPIVSDLGMHGDLRGDLAGRGDAASDLSRPLSDQVTLGAPKSYAVAQRPYSLRAQDVNRDGKPDLIAVGDRLNVLLGRGDGTFQDALDVGAAAGTGLDVGDLNADGKPDVVLPLGGNLQVFLGRGDGSFETSRNSPLGNSLTGAALGDVNGDGKLDLAVGDNATGPDHLVHVLPGRGDGSFGTPVSLVVGRNPRALRLIDLNRDGRLDLVVANYGGNSASVALGKGDGTFAAAQTLSSEPSPASLAVADMNGDGALDLLVGSSTRASMSLHLGRGDGTFQPADARAVTPAYPTHQLAVGDVNGDAALDVVTCDGSSNPLLVHLGKGGGSFFPARPFAAGTNLFSIVLEDFNADGRRDVAVSNTAVPSQITVLLNTTAAP